VPVADSLSGVGDCRCYQIPVAADEHVFALLDKDSRWYSGIGITEGRLPTEEELALSCSDQSVELTAAADGYCYVRVCLGYFAQCDAAFGTFTIAAHDETTFPSLEKCQPSCPPPPSIQLNWDGDCAWYQVSALEAERLLIAAENDSGGYLCMGITEGRLPGEDELQCGCGHQSVELTATADGYCYVRVCLSYFAQCDATSGTFTITAHNDGCLPVWIPLGVGWRMISLPLEPVDKTILIDRTTRSLDPRSIFAASYCAGNDPRMRLFGTEPGVGYWTYDPNPYPDYSWYELGVEPPPGYPDPGPWWQGFWLWVDTPQKLKYAAFRPSDSADAHFLDITASPGAWAWMMFGACARTPTPYNPDVTTWPTTSTVTDLGWGKSPRSVPPVTWVPTCTCLGPNARDLGYIGLPLDGYVPGVGYYSVSPPCCGPADTDSLTPGEGYWLDVEDPEVWMRVLAGQYPP
jgi:hypothetical protein